MNFIPKLGFSDQNIILTMEKVEFILKMGFLGNLDFSIWMHILAKLGPVLPSVDQHLSA